jgi:hypothetical protein
MQLNPGQLITEASGRPNWWCVLSMVWQNFKLTKFKSNLLIPIDMLKDLNDVRQSNGRDLRGIDVIVHIFR